MRSGSELSLTEARRLAITAQGLAKPRPKGPIGRRHLRALVDTIGTIQLDAINVVGAHPVHRAVQPARCL